MRLMAGLAMAMCCGTGAFAAEAGDNDQLMNAAFAPDRGLAGEDQSFAAIAERETFAPDGAPVRWRTGKVKLSNKDTLRVSVGSALQAPGGLPLRLDRAEAEAQAYEVALTREWKGVKVEAGDYDLRFAPRAGVGVGRNGGQAEAGAMITLGQRADAAVKDRLAGMGVKDGDSFGDQGRWYLFAAASGRAVGMNLLRSEGGLDRAGWSTDSASKLIGDAHIGVGWRKGDMQTAFGVIHREVKGQHMVWGQETRDDTMVALSFAIRPE